MENLRIGTKARLTETAKANIIEIRLQEMQDQVYLSIQVTYNSEGKILTKNELKYHIRNIVTQKLNFAIWEFTKIDVPCLELIDIKNLLMSQK